MLQDSTVTWEPEFARIDFTWQTVVAGVAIAAALLVYGKALYWFVTRRVAVTGWRATRYSLPTLMLLLSAPAIVLAGNHPGWLADVVTGVAVLLNLAIIPLVAGFAWVVERSDVRGLWMAPVVIILFWAGWYGVIRLMEWRHEMNVPLESLHLGAAPEQRYR